jgi:hypothetical protein
MNSRMHAAKRYRPIAVLRRIGERMRVNTQLSFFILFAAISYAANAQPLKVTTTVAPSDRTTVALNQRLALTVTLSGDGAHKTVERPSPPDLGEALRLFWVPAGRRRTYS